MKNIKKLEKAIYKRKHTKKIDRGKTVQKKHEQQYGASLYKRKPESWME